MNKKQKEILKLQLSQEKDLIEELKVAYKTALNDIQGKLKVLMTQKEIQSKIYRKQYLKALEKQLSGIIEVLEGENVQIITERLMEAYENGYLGSLYIMNGYGVPLLFGIDEKSVLTSVFKSIENMTFAERMNVNMNDFKKTIKAEITRGIANNSSYGEVAKQIKLRIKESFNRSYRIAQTEMSRVSSEAKFDSMTRAKEDGAEVYKEWCATLDLKTRPAHQKLDGQKREIDEPFTYQGHKAMHPHGFNVAGLDINCRCTLLEVPKWIDTSSPQNRRDGITGQVIQANTYEEWINKYYSKESVEYIKYVEKMRGEYKANFKDTLAKMTDEEYEKLSALGNKIKKRG